MKFKVILLLLYFSQLHLFSQHFSSRDAVRDIATNRVFDKSNRWSDNNDSISAIHLLVQSKFDSTFYIKFHPRKQRLEGYEIVYTNSMAIEQITALAKLQNTYSQGYDGKWYGPDKETMFSWGAKMADLVFDGSAYNYDTRGRLVNRDAGNGIPAQVYDATSFFNTGFETANTLTLKLPAFSRAYFDIGIRQNHYEGVIRGNNNNTYNLSLALKRLATRRFLMNVSTSYNYAEGTLMNHGANQAAVLGAVYATPISFDNANGLDASEAIGNRSTWTQTDGKLRSFMPHGADNPFGLVAQNKDRDELHHGTVTVNMLYQLTNWKLGLVADVDLQQDNRTMGYLSGYRRSVLDFRYDRTQYRMFTGSNAFASWHRRNLTLYSTFDYHFYQDRLNLGYTTNNISTVSNYKNHRNVYQWVYGADYMVDKIHTKFRFANRHYFSTTARDYSNWMPSAGFDVNILRFAYSKERNSSLLLRASIARSLKETDLILGAEVPYTAIPVSQYEQYVPVDNLFFHSGLRPEIHTDKSLELVFKYNKTGVWVEYFQIDTDDFISFKDGELENLGGTRTKGWKASGKYSKTFSNGWALNMDVDWYKSESTVEKLNFDEDFITMAGFKEVQKVFAKGKSLGAIYGSDFQKDAQGRNVVGSDGFPVKSAKLIIVGDATPDWIMRLRPKVSWRDLELLLDVELKKGGDMWNGTDAYLDYLGRSQTTGDLRNTTGYVFGGVTSNGETNTKAVNFSQANVLENRWTRYGMDGVTAEYIQDASWLRMSEVNLRYNVRLHGKGFKDLQIGFSIRNLFVITPYKGVDPSSSLFNYSAGEGLDLFNSPSVRTYMLTLKMRISDVLR